MTAPSTPYAIQVYNDLEALSREAAKIFSTAAAEALEEEGKCAIALSGGSTPRRLYEILSSEPYRTLIPWDSVHLFWGDERMVPPDHPNSNYRMVYETLLSHIDIPPENIHRMKGELPPEQAAAAYEEELRAYFGTLPDSSSSPSKSGSTHSASGNPVPSFTLILAGLGADGHTASLFPGAPALQEEKRWVVHQFVEKLRAFRLTLTPPVFNAAQHLLFLVSGEEKADILDRVLHAPFNPAELPAQIIKPHHGQLTWLVDRQAAKKLTP